MTDLQQRQRELLVCFLGVCEALDLSWYLVCGSALGAAKYGGFIPWDDDIDVALPRGDYEKFLRLAPGRLPEYLFLQNYRSDPGFPQIYSKLRDSRTTCIEESARFLPIHHGVGMDIFPLDGYPEGRWAGWRLELGKKWYAQLLGTAFAPPEGALRRTVYRLKRGLGLHRRTAQIAARYDALLRQYPPEASRLWCSHGNWQGKREYAPREQYGEGQWGTFEGLAVQLPRDLEGYLTRKYGNYRADPPRQASHHRYAVVDLSRSYRAYTEEVQT